MKKRTNPVKICIAAILVLALCFGGYLMYRSYSAPVRTRAFPEGVDLVPVPVKASLSENRSKWTDSALLSPEVSDYNDIFETFGFQIGKGGVPVVFKNDALLGEEAYKLSVKREHITVTASDERGVFAAISTLSQLVCDGRIVASKIEDKPSTPFRGVIEGFYGNPWSHAYRLDLFAFMGRYKLNTYIYAPKSDAKHRAEWRSMYTGEELDKMQELIDCAARNNVRFVYALSPGLDIDLGDGYEDDFRRLMDKCDSMYELGVRDFAILLDDINTLDAQGHAKLVNDFQRRFIRQHSDCANLIAITPEYCSHMCTGYSEEIAPLLDPDILVMWTGNAVIPSSITQDDLNGINLLLNRNVYIWWNYPVNDYATNDLNLSPCENLDTKLYRSVSGFVSNPMNQGYASMIPLVTIADYLWNPFAYDPEESFRAATRRLAPDCTDGLYSLMDLTRGSLINGKKSTFSLSDAVEAYNSGKDSAAEELRAQLVKVRADLTQFSGSDNKDLASEIKPWLDKAESCVDAAIDLMDYKLAGDSAAKIEKAMSFVQNYRTCSENPAVVSPDVLMPLLQNAKAEINALVAAVGDARALRVKTVSTDMPTYQNYEPSNAIDGESDTCFWSSAPPAVDDCFTVDLGEVSEIAGVHLAMGSAYNKNDFIHSGVIEYSADGDNYTVLCETNGSDTVSEARISGRYVRVRCTEAQSYWVIISEFEIKTVYVLPDWIEFDGSDTTDFSPLFDKDLFSAFSPDPAEIGGKTLTIDAAELSSVELFLLKTEGMRVFVQDESGKPGEEIALSAHTVIPTDNIREVSIVFSDEAASAIAEVICK